MIVEDIKEFLKTKNLNWTGEIIASLKGKNFKPATEEDFKNLAIIDFLFDFGEDGEIALSMEVDEITLKIYGESFDFCYSKYAGDNVKIKKIIEDLEDKDFSEEFIKFQLKESGLVYASAIKLKCLEKQKQINEESERRQKQLKRKIDYLTNNIEKNENERLEKCSKIEEIIEMIDLQD